MRSASVSEGCCAVRCVRRRARAAAGRGDSGIARVRGGTRHISSKRQRRWDLHCCQKGESEEWSGRATNKNKERKQKGRNQWKRAAGPEHLPSHSPQARHLACLSGQGVRSTRCSEANASAERRKGREETAGAKEFASRRVGAINAAKQLAAETGRQALRMSASP